MRLESLLVIMIVLPLVLLFPTVQARAAIITVGPSDCSAPLVNNAISSASDGDTVLLTCTGSVTWSSLVSIPSTKGITLAVKGGTNSPKGSANFPLTVVSSVSLGATLKVTAGPNNSLSRVTGFKFQNAGVTAGERGLLWVSGCGQGKTGLGSFRIDNNYFDTISGRAIIAIYSTCNKLYGLFDNNTMHDAFRADDLNYGPYGIQIWNDFKDANGCWGANGWTDPLTFGNVEWVFIEDNLFENLTTPKMMRHYVSHEEGGRSVVRYNTFVSNATAPDGGAPDFIEGHGLCICATNGCGVRAVEVYRNTMQGSAVNRYFQVRGGSWLIYDNTFSSAWNRAYASPIMLMEYRAGSSQMYNQCLTSATCPCTSPWYPSVTDGSKYPLAQQIFGTYAWGNLYQGVNRDPAVDPAGVQPLYIQQGRDYFTSTSKPAALSSYTPFIYPHPLRNASNPPPSPPQSLAVQ